MIYMSEKNTYANADNNTVPAANNSVTINDSPVESPPNPTVSHVEEFPIPTVKEALVPTCPNPDKGFQSLSGYQVKRTVKRVMHHMKVLCKKRRIGLDLGYWKQLTTKILSARSTKDVLVISAPAGSGKSTWIEAFTRAIVELFQMERELSDALVGIAIVVQKVEDLNRLAAALNSDSTANIPNMVALQGWSISGQKNGFCQNSSVDNFAGCHPQSCPFASSCKVLAFRKLAQAAPIVGLTQERFVMLRASGDLDGVLFRREDDGRLRPRRYLFIDEKFQMAQIYTLDKSCIDQASMEFSALIKKIDATDSQVRSLQQYLSYYIERPFQDLRRSLCVKTDRGRQDIQAGLCALPAKYTDPEEKSAFQKFYDLVLCQKKQYAAKNLRTALAVMEALYHGERCLFSKTNGFAITYILPPPLQYGESLSIIFDATAEVDEDYRSLQNAKFSSGAPERKPCSLNLHVYTNRSLNVSKKSMLLSWKISALSQFTAELIKDTKGDVFLCCYKDYAEALADSLQKIMPAESYRCVLLMPDREHDTIPYFGGTNGSNNFNTATEVIMLGYPRLNPKDYLICASAAYGSGQIADELAVIGEENLLSKYPDLLWTIPSVKTYMAHHLAARLEQEIYRCALRNPDFTGEINVHLFCPPSDLLEILCSRLKPTNVITHDELPMCVEACQRSARSYEGQPTQYGRLVRFLANWDGSKISVQQLRTDLKISQAVWKDLMKDNRVKELLEQQQVQRWGRGTNAFWCRQSQGQCA